MKLLLTFLGALSLFPLWPAHSGSAQQKPETLQVASRLVNVDVVVTDRRTGLPVHDLHKRDFELLDDGHPVKIAWFSRPSQRDRPFVLVLFIEVDNSIRPILPNLEGKLDQALRSLEPADQVAVFVFDPWNFQQIQTLTSSRQLVLQALSRAAELQKQNERSGQYKKFEALPNAMIAGADYVQAHRGGARAAFVVVGSDFDVVSGKLAAETSKRLLSAGVTVSCLLKSDSQTSAAKFMVRAMTLPSAGSARADVGSYLASETGGKTITVHENDYGEALERIIGNVSQRYSLGFVPNTRTLDGRFHKIAVRVKRGGHPRVRTRRGYYAIP